MTDGTLRSLRIPSDPGPYEGCQGTAVLCPPKDSSVHCGWNNRPSNTAGLSFRKRSRIASIPRSRGDFLIRANLARAFALLIVFCGAFAPPLAFAEDGNQSQNKANTELSAQVLSLLALKSMPKRSPILVRIFKEESELEVWKQDTSGRFELLKVYPICRWSGDLGPKITEGDRQAPEGFYPITPGLMNPNSNLLSRHQHRFPKRLRPRQ
jgi:hypothetical protein